MGSICINFGGGGGITSDDVTATRDTVLSGYKTLMTDSNDEPVEGAIPVHIGNVKAEQVYLDDNKVTFSAPYGYSRFNDSSNDMRSYRTYGELTAAIGLTSDNVAVNNSILGIDGTYKGLGNVTAAQVLSGYTFSSSSISNGTGTLSISSVVSFRVAQYSNLTLIASWAKPSKGPWSGLHIMCKQGNYPSNANDGTLFYDGSGTSATKTLASGTWYFRVWNYITTSQGKMYGSYIQTTCANNQIKGQQVFTSSGTFIVPASVRSIDIFCVGGGGAGSWGHNNVSDEYSRAISAGGGSGYTSTLLNISVSPGQQLPVTIGAGGLINPNANIAAGSGGKTNIGQCTADGGSGGKISRSDWMASGQYQVGGNGGTGGSIYRAHGTSDGANGNYNAQQGLLGSVGTGQGRNTRAFGENVATLYAGSGAGGTIVNGEIWVGGTGGGGNGGTGRGGNGGNGVVGTGGGGGGGGMRSNTESDPGAGGIGGSGIAIVRWGY